MVNLLKPGKFYKNIAKLRGGFLVYKELTNIFGNLGLSPKYISIFEDDLVFVVENLGEKISPGSKNIYITYKILTKDCIGYILVFNNCSSNWVEVTSC